ncbi:hypothetical protein DFH07DRAFT_1057717 [Mycena maculata]|uniref:STB6-like N-terminal domain-containing protein n=1 Tax=Mycena maculata TaxID=230809 RepID=A0AAD7NRB4_9AGAR|nr:hypothetical protein DFH07DRAFT_1057717 [Mycena maculata]
MRLDQTLLLPTVRQPQSRPSAPLTHHRTKSKLARASVDITAPLPRPWSLTDTANDWIGLPLRFEIVTDRLELDGYQIYAVEKWIVERDRPVTVLTVYTGDPAHKITVTALRPSPTLSPEEATAEWDKAILHLRRDARPRETPHGIVLATSLAHFRSDYTIVNIPNGDFLAARDQLYTNINLLRMGCSGRSALTLEEPSETTKDRFIATYHLPDTIVSASVSATSPGIQGSPVPSPQPSPHKHRPRVSISPPTHRSQDTNGGASSPTSRRPPTTLHITPPTPTFVVPYGLTSPTGATTPGGRYTAKGKTRGDRAAFSASVLELVRLIQAGLTIFGMFPADPRALDGLLCDKTVEGLGTWVTDVGEQCVNIEATERIADPAVVCALLSLVLATRNKLAAMGFAHVIPKDPFLRPHGFLVALGAYINGSTNASGGVSTPATPAFPFHLHHSLPPTPAASTLALAVLTPKAPTGGVVLTRALVDAVGASYSDKVRAGERRRPRARALLGLDGEGSDGGSGGEGADTGAADGGGGQILTGIGNLVGLNVGGCGAGGAAGVLEPSVDLEAFVRVVVGRAKDKGKGKTKGKTKEKEGRPGESEAGEAVAGRGKEKEKERERDAAVLSGVAGCVRGLWSGLIWGVVCLRERELEGPVAHTVVKRDVVGTPERDRERGKERWAPVVVSDGETEETDPRAAKGERDGRSTEEEGGGPDKWGGRVQKKFESWTRLSRLDRKKGHTSVDLSSGRDSLDDPLGPTLLRKRTPLLMQHDLLSPLTFARGERDARSGEEDLSSGQVSPVGGVEDPRTPKQFDAMRSAASSAANLNAEEYDRKLSAFNHKRPWGARMTQNRVSSWSDPVSAREILDADESEESMTGEGSVASSRLRRARSPAGSRLARPEGSILGEEEEVLYEEPSDAGYLSDAVPPPRRRITLGPQRRRSWHQDPVSFKDLKVLSPERMRIDVQLCGQVLIMTRREEHLKNVLACVRILTASLSDTNTRLREDYESHVRTLAEVEKQTRAIADIDVEGSKADKILQAQNTISYETQQFLVPDLWHIARPPRHATFALRDKVFGNGRRLPPGKHGAHGRFNRLQWTLDGQERLVDYLGRTESEAEEESVVGMEEEVPRPPTDDEEDSVIKHPAMRPMWLLRFFTSWGAKWGATQPDADAKAKAKPLGGENNGRSVPPQDIQSKFPIPVSRASI